MIRAILRNEVCSLVGGSAYSEQVRNAGRLGFNDDQFRLSDFC